MTREWHYSFEGEKCGPVPAAELKRLAREGTITPNDLVWKAGLDDWLPASKIKGLFPKDVSEPPPLPITKGGLTKLQRAEHNNMLATQCLTECQAHLEVCENFLKDKARDGIEFANAALNDYPESSSYLNTKALLIADGLGTREEALDLLRQALAFEPDSVLLKQNIRKLENPPQSFFPYVLAVLLVLLALVCWFTWPV